MNRIFTVLIFFIVGCSPSKTSRSSLPAIPADLKGNFKDDYGITYTINDSEWIQHPRSKYHILRYDSTGPFFIAKNDVANSSDANLYTRIDVMRFSNMEPYRWGFCLTAYKAKTAKEAIATQSADREHPMKGCGGYPFSRMKRDP